MEKDLAEELRTQRRRAYLTQRQLGEMVGVHRGTVYAWEKGHRRPGLPSMAKLSAIFPAEAMDRILAATQ